MTSNGCLAISHDPGPPPIEDDIEHASDRYLLKLKSYAKALPYSIESNARMQELLDLICMRIVQAVQARDYDPGFLQWDSMLTYWSYLKYPIPKEKRILLVDLYYSLCTMPGMQLHIVATCSDALENLTRSKNKLSIEDIRLPWFPIFDILRHDLFLTRRQFEVSQTSYYMGTIAGTVQRFFHPAAIDQMLETFVPLINGTNLNSLLSTQFYMLTFLPQSHPQSYLPMFFRLWESINSYMFDERMLQFLAQLVEMHVDPSISDPRKIEEIPDDARSENEGRPNWAKKDLSSTGLWTGIFKDVGIFTDYDWHFIMCKCLASMEIPLADSGSLTTGPSADNQAGFEIGRLPKPAWRIASLARIIVYSMSPDGLPTAPSSTPTPLGTPFASGMSTPRNQSSSIGDYLAAPLGKLPFLSLKSYIGGSKALDSLVKLIASTESFFHPSNSGAWTADLTAFIKHVAYEFNKRNLSLSACAVSLSLTLRMA
jgi:proteasome activator subunit 4